MDMMSKKTKRPSSRFWGYLPQTLAILLSFFLVLNLVVYDRSYSDTENRPLHQFPAPYWNSLVSGKYGQQLEDYVSDQFVGRNFFFHADYLIRKLGGQREISNVFLGKKALLAQVMPPSGDLPGRQVEAINRFCSQTGLSSSVLVAPAAATIQKQKLPAFAPVYDENPMLDGIYDSLATSKADIRSSLDEHRSEYIYYRTDHHWTSLGARYGAMSFLASLGKEMNPDDFENLKVSDSFQGTLASKTGSFLLKDDLYICPDKKQTQYLVTWNDGSKTTSIYDQTALKHKDQYQLFLGQNQGLVHVETLSESQDSLLLFKDSYANSMIQYLIPYFQNIYIVDPRYYNDDLGYILVAGNITHVGFVFSSGNFATESSLCDVLESYLSSHEQAE